MGLRPGRCYRLQNKRAFTRTAVKVHKRNYIGATPGIRTRQFNTGNPLRKYSHVVDLITDEKVQIRDNSLEAIRIAVNRDLTKNAGKENFFLRIRIYPYHILRENKQAQGAGADRVTKGMSHPYGKPIGRAARVRKGQKILSLLVNEEHLDAAKDALNKAKPKLTCKILIKVGTDIESIGTLPKRVKRRKEKEEKEEADKKAEDEKAGEKGKDEKKDDKGKEADKKDDKDKDTKKDDKTAKKK